MAAIRIFRRLAELLDVAVSSPADGEVLAYDSGAEKWVNSAAGGGASALTDLSDVTGTPAAGEAPVYDGAGFALTDVATQTELDSHAADTTSVHGIADTSVLETTTGAQAKADAAEAAAEAASDPAGTAASAVATHTADTTSVHGIADTSALYATGGTDVAVADGGTGSSTAAGARTNLGLVVGTDVEAHDADLTAIAALDSSTSGAIASDGAGWVKKTYAQFKTALSLAAGDVGLGNVTNDAQIAKSLVDAKGDLIVATADNTPARLAVGSDGNVLTADAASAGGVKWAAAAGGGSGVPTFAAAILALSPYLYWEMQDASGNAADASGNGRDGTVGGTPTYRAAGPGPGALTQYGIQFGATGGNVQVATPNLQNNFSIVMCYYPVSNSASRQIFASGGGGSQFTIATTSTNLYAVTVQGVAVESNSTIKLSPNAWNLVVVVRDGTIWKYYTNGQIDNLNAGNAAPGASQTGNMQAGGVTVVGDRMAHYAVINSVLQPPDIDALWMRLKLGA